MSIEAEVVIMDEPTASLSHKEIEELFVLIELLKKDKRVILFISNTNDVVTASPGSPARRRLKRNDRGRSATQERRAPAKRGWRAGEP